MKASDNAFPGIVIRESANDGSDFSNPSADYRRLFLGEDGQLHVKDSAGSVTGIGGAVSEITDIPTADTTTTNVLSPDGAGGTEWRAEAGGSVAADAIWDAAGDLAVGSGANTAARLAKGADVTVLQMASGAVGWAEMPGRLLGVNSRSANGSNYSTTSATLADVDASNSLVTFTAPASGNVLVKMTAAISIGSTQNAFFGIRESTTEVGAKRLVRQGAVSADIVTCEWLITGISAGSHTYKAAFAINGGATITIFQEGAGTGNGAVVLQVWAAP